MLYRAKTKVMQVGRGDVRSLGWKSVGPTCVGSCYEEVPICKVYRATEYNETCIRQPRIQTGPDEIKTKLELTNIYSESDKNATCIRQVKIQTIPDEIKTKLKLTNIYSESDKNATCIRQVRIQRTPHEIKTKLTLTNIYSESDKAGDERGVATAVLRKQT